MMDEYTPLIIGLLFLVSIIISFVWGLHLYTPEPEYKISSIVFKRTVPAFYGLCGTKTETITINDPLHIHDWEIGIFKPEGYVYVCTNYELEEGK